MKRIELNQKTINFLYILAQQNITLVDMFKTKGWIGEHGRWNEADLLEALADMRRAVKDHQTEYKSKWR